MNKKTYVAPTVEIINIETVGILAASNPPKIDIVVGGEGSEQLSTGRRGSWGNLWNGDKE